ncbi:transcription regulator Crp family protein [Paenibacillus mucilaginosus 3016]|uniref:Transcription regulator Crp family protein n=2 Tax=Paenibacillus mucilaginosus TaxID=61624 RepID=H6NKE1_9BACL|nr:Crp/Fnr family transcriptional regulator [Paenibacillus mucilaginosus]AFC32332.1 transcription regulator Crp family protein [Paenibacillus mucilaginosus 3016]AFH64639.1 regulatory protein [Paenibacillus mucilaginosus K02]WFA20828.1 Crp/Fnr family transcriptional regulator [Paenibacillus mucilaginosus]
MQTATKQTMTERPYHIPQFLSSANMERLEKVMVLQRASEGSHLFWEGDTADKLYFVKKGAVKLMKSTEDGRSIILQIAQAGDLFGEFGDPGAMSFGYDAVVLAEATLGVIALSDLENLMRSSGDFAVEFVKWQSLMQRAAQTKLRDLLLYGKSGALAATLIRLASSCGIRTERGVRISMRLTHTDLAHMIGSTRESVNRLISEYRAEGALDFQKGYITVKDEAFFKDMVGGTDIPLELCRI